MVAASGVWGFTPAQAQTYLGNLSANPYGGFSTAAPGADTHADSVTNPTGRFGSRNGAASANNPYAVDAPKLYDDAGQYRGKLSANPFDAESTANPYGRYGSAFSPDSINNKYGAGSPYHPDSPYNPHGHGLKIFGKE